jgi:hypothetical protein
VFPDCKYTTVFPNNKKTMPYLMKIRQIIDIRIAATRLHYTDIAFG